MFFFVLIQYINVKDEQTDRQTLHNNTGIASYGKSEQYSDS